MLSLIETILESDVLTVCQSAERKMNKTVFICFNDKCWYREEASSSNTIDYTISLSPERYIGFFINCIQYRHYMSYVQALFEFNVILTTILLCRLSALKQIRSWRVSLIF